MNTRTDNRNHSSAADTCHRSGTLTLTPRGFGFVQPETGPSILVPYDHLSSAASGDVVDVEVFADSAADKPAGRVVSVLKRNGAPVVGRIRIDGSSAAVLPHAARVSREVAISGDELSRFAGSVGGTRPKSGDIVSCSVVDWGDEKHGPLGRIDTVLARKNDRDAELKLIAVSRGFELDFPEVVASAAARLAEPALPTDAGKQSGTRQRVDLRETVCFTIDPEGARDHDDALSIRQLDSGLLEVGIHIADVTHFVAENDPIDIEARHRSTSVYLVDHVIPMLPERLSHDLCSLVPNKDRFAVTVNATIDSRGEVHNVSFCESVIRSRRRLTYAEAEEVIRGKADPLAREIHLLNLLAQTLRVRREQDGSIDLDLSAPLIRVDDDGVPVSITPAQRRDANRMVEECMLLANRLVAEYLVAHPSVPGLYRTHPVPRESDMESLIATLGELGIRYTSGRGISEDYRSILAIVQNFEFRDLVESLASRALSKAVYSTTNDGHFGLAMDAYTHFTSPIRRYPDVLVHRLLKRAIGQRSRGGRKEHPSQLDTFLSRAAEHANERERMAAQAEREYTRMKALEFLTTKIGKRYAGVVTGVASIGVFVEIERYLIDGLVPIGTLGKERFAVDRDRHSIVGSKSGVSFRIGDRVTVAVKGVDVEARTATFALCK